MRQQHDARLALGEPRREVFRRTASRPIRTRGGRPRSRAPARSPPSDRRMQPAVTTHTRSPGEQRFTTRRLHRPGAARGEEQHLALGAEDLLQARERALVDDAEVRAAVVDDRLGRRREHLGRHRRRPGCEQVALLGHRLEPNGETGLRSPRGNAARVRGIAGRASACRSRRRPMARAACAGAPGLECGSFRVRRRLGRARLGRGARLGRPGLPRLLPLRRSAHRAAARRGLAPDLAAALGRAGRARLRRACGRYRDRRARPRLVLRRRHPGGAGSPRLRACTPCRGRGQYARYARRSSSSRPRRSAGGRSATR